jgi:hypothetical protein
METLPTTMVDGTMLLGCVILIASIGFEVNRYIVTNFITLFYKYIKASRHAIPWPFTPVPTRSPIDCDVAGRVIFRIRPSSVLGRSLAYFCKIYDRYVIAT